MNTTRTLQEAGYNSAELKNWRKLTFKKRILKSLILLFILLGITFYCFQYLANLPRERHANRATYLERVQMGFKRLYSSVWLTLMADFPDPKNTKLPIAELYIKGERLDLLNEALPESGKTPQKANFKIAGEEYEVEANYRGDSVNHWALPQKSWRITLEKDEYYEGYKSLNLNVPRVETQISNWLGYELGRQIDAGLVPDCDFVHFRVNRQFDGVRLLLEQPNTDFLLKRNLALGKIYIGDITTEQIYGNVPRKPLYKDITAWKVEAISDHDQGLEEMQELQNIIAFEHDPYKFYQRLSNVMDMDALLRYIALLEIVGSVHVDETHNGKFYFNPVAGKFVPIVWDTVAYMWKDRFLPDIAVNNLFRVVLSNPEFRETKDKIIWEALKGKLSTENIISLIDTKVNQIKPDVRAFALKIKANDKGIEHISNERWEESIVELKDAVRSRNRRFKTHISNSTSVFNVQKTSDSSSNLIIKVDSAVGIVLKTINLKLSPEPRTIKLKRLAMPDKNISGFDFSKAEVKEINYDGSGALSIELNDHLYSKRRYQERKDAILVPAVYIYEFDTLISKDIKIKATNAITGKGLNVRFSEELKLPEQIKPNSVWWSPVDLVKQEPVILNGEINLTQDLIVPTGTDLIIQAGSQIKLAPDVSIVVNKAELKLQGTSEQPIIITSLDEQRPWGVLAVNSGKADFQHTKIIGGSDTRRNFTYYSAPISLHNSQSRISDIELIDSHISVKYGDIELKKVKYTGVHKQAVFVEAAGYKEKELSIINTPRVHSASLLNVAAFGTTARSEREYKYTILADINSDDDLQEYAMHINKALSEALDKKDFWQAPIHTGSNYRIDLEPKPFLYRDIYFDTIEGLLYREQISYRLRNRFKNLKDYGLYVKNQHLPQYWPYRLEFQAKTNRKELGEGFSTSDEARFEFRKESLPFNDIKRPPMPPWDMEEFLPYFLTGKYKGMATLPAQSVMQALEKWHGGEVDLTFEPRAVVLTERSRQHFNIKSEWGSGPNPEQAYIISLDKSIIYDGKPYLAFLEARKLGDKDFDKPVEVGTLLEIELEFERNVSAVLDEKIKDLENVVNRDQAQEVEFKKLTAAREAFLADQKNIIKVIKDYFAKLNIDVVAANKSKYVQTIDLMN